MSNARQIGVHMSIFVAENHEYPLAMDLGGPSGINRHQKATWLQSVFQKDYTDGMRILDCPAAARPGGWPDNEAYSEYGYNAYGSSYGFGLGGHIKSDSTPAEAQTRAIKESEVTSPSETYALGDGLIGAQDIISDGSWVLGRRKDVQDQRGSMDRSKKRHAGRAVIAFCDGHVELIPLPRLFADNSDEALSRWNRDHLPHRDGQ